MNARTLLALSALLTLALPTGSASATGTAPRESKASAAGAAGDGKKLFISGTTPSCATCHMLRDAGATGNIGPDLDALKPDAARVKNAVAKGFENMPAFGTVLSPTQIDALASYVANVAGGGQ